MSFIPWFGIPLGLALIAWGYRHYRRLQRRAIRRNTYWSIGYQRSSDRLRWDPSTAEVFDRSQAGGGITTLADPFVIRHEGDTFLFCEVLVSGSPLGKIAVAVLDRATDRWDFKGIVLDEPFHLSYPQVFADGADLYMLPETKGARSVRLYRAAEFPTRWTLVQELIEGVKLVDPTLYHRDDTWYLFATRRNQLHLYYAGTLTGDWRPHPGSPFRKGESARCAGRIVEIDGQPHRFTQEQGNPGACVRGYRIVELTRERFAEVPVDRNPVLAATGEAWTRLGLHHLDSCELPGGDYFGVFDGRGTVQR